jgi:hypothetical protein
MHAITLSLFSKDVYSVPLRGVRLRGCAMLDWGRGRLQKCFRIYQNLSGHIIIFPKIRKTVIFQINFLMSWELHEFPWKSSANLLEINPKIHWKSTWNCSWAIISGCCPPPHTHTHTHTPWCVSSERSLIYRPCISPTKVLCIIL